MAVVLWLLLAEALYVRALRVLGGRGVRVPRSQILCWHLGLSLQAIALLSPLGGLGHELLSAHMVEHLLLADLGAPLLLAGARNPVLGFYLPREVLVPLARNRRLRIRLAAPTGKAAARVRAPRRTGRPPTSAKSARATR